MRRALDAGLDLNAAFDRIEATMGDR